MLEFSLWTEANETPGALSDYVPLAQDIFTETLPLLVVDDELIVAAFQKQPSQWKMRYPCDVPANRKFVPRQMMQVEGSAASRAVFAGSVCVTDPVRVIAAKDCRPPLDPSTREWEGGVRFVPQRRLSRAA